MARQLRNVGASVRDRLLALSREMGLRFDLLLTRYALERLLFRLSQTQHGKCFALKGAMLMTSWFDDPLRPTRDIDFLGFGDADGDAMLNLFREVMAVAAEDGVDFDVDQLTVTAIREELAYGGLRLQTYATIDGARVRIVIDIGFGDATEPGLEEVELAVLLDQPSVRLQGYAKETVIAEKLQAMVALGKANTRLKDYYDIWALAQSYEFDVDRLAKAIAATFKRRDTPIPTDLPEGLDTAFADDKAKVAQWQAFTRGVAVDPGPLDDTIATLVKFLMPVMQRAVALA